MGLMSFLPPSQQCQTVVGSWWTIHHLTAKRMDLAPFTAAFWWHCP